MRIRIRWRQHGKLESCPDSGVKRLSKRAYLGCYDLVKHAGGLTAVKDKTRGRARAYGPP